MDSRPTEDVVVLFSLFYSDPLPPFLLDCCCFGLEFYDEQNDTNLVWVSTLRPGNTRPHPVGRVAFLPEASG